MRIEWKDLSYRSIAYCSTNKRNYYLEVIYPHKNDLHYIGNVLLDRICIFNGIYAGVSLEKVKERLWSDCVRYQIQYWANLQKELENVGNELG